MRQVQNHLQNYSSLLRSSEKAVLLFIWTFVYPTELVIGPNRPNNEYGGGLVYVIFNSKSMWIPIKIVYWKYEASKKMNL